MLRRNTVKLVAICLLFCCALNAQRQWTWGYDSTKLSYPHTIYLEGLGSGALGSMNYECRLLSVATWSELRFRTGIGYYHGPGLVAMPVITFGSGTMRGELSAGVLIQRSEVAVPLVIGFRYEAKDGLFARLTYSPIWERYPDFNHNYPFPIWFGVSVGFQVMGKNKKADPKEER